MANAGTIAVSFVAKGLQKLNSDLDKAKNKSHGFGSTLASIGKAAPFMALAAGAAVATAAIAVLYKGMSAVSQSVSQAYKEMDELSKSADRLGMTTEGLVGLTHGADLAGGSAEEFTNSMDKMNDAVGTAMQGNPAAQKAFERLGISMDQLTSMNPEQRLFAVSDALKNIKDPALKAATAQDIFGKKSKEMLSFLAGGSSAMKESIKDAEKLGITFERVDGAKIEQRNDALRRMELLMVGLGRAIATYLAPVFEAFANNTVIYVTGLIERFGGLQNIVSTVGQVTMSIIGPIISSFKFWYNSVKMIINIIQMLVSGVAGGLGKILGFVMSFQEKVINAITPLMEWLGFGDVAKDMKTNLNKMQKDVEEFSDISLGIAKESGKEAMKNNQDAISNGIGFFTGKGAADLEEGFGNLTKQSNAKAEGSVLGTKEDAKQQANNLVEMGKKALEYLQKKKEEYNKNMSNWQGEGSKLMDESAKLEADKKKEEEDKLEKMKTTSAGILGKGLSLQSMMVGDDRKEEIEYSKKQADLLEKLYKHFANKPEMATILA